MIAANANSLGFTYAVITPDHVGIKCFTFSKACQRLCVGGGIHKSDKCGSLQQDEQESSVDAHIYGNVWVDSDRTLGRKCVRARGEEQGLASPYMYYIGSLEIFNMLDYQCLAT